jgi:ABC-type nitrate/sulfonate/bicarbonate transport system substrate-binding protein
MLSRLIITLIIFFLTAHATEKVSLQLLWLHQFQFAGYYMAKEKGYYADAGLDVKIKSYSYGLDIASEVINKKSTYGVGGSSLILDASKGKHLKLLASILQSSPLILSTI